MVDAGFEKDGCRLGGRMDEARIPDVVDGILVER